MDKGKVIGAVCISEKNSPGEISFEEILLDETLIEGDIWILKEALQTVGGINYRLYAKQNYELLLRIAKEYKVLLLTNMEGFHKIKGPEEVWECLEPEAEDFQNAGEEGLKTDCYLIGRYKAELLAAGCFDDAVLGIYSSGGKAAMEYLEQMISGTEEFYEIYDCTQPILIYTGSHLCYNILDTFSAELGWALQELGQNVEYFDMQRQHVTEITAYAGRRFKAVIGMQTNAFSVKWKDGSFFHDSIAAPKYHFVFDHPLWIKDYMEERPGRLRILTLDGNNAKFVESAYGCPAKFFPPAGSRIFYDIPKRDYEVTFLGSYDDGLMENLRHLKNADKKRRCLINRYILYMRKDLSMTPQEAFKKALEYYGIPYSTKEFLETFYEERWVIIGLANYYRNKVVETLLKAGIVLHVFGGSWKESPMWGHPLLCYHEAVSGREEPLKVYARSKISLNIMRWHKDGFTERIANSMLQKAAVISDRTTCLEKNFVNGEDILLFDLGHLEELPEKITELLHDERKRARIAENGYQKAIKFHTWQNRAEEMLQLIEEDRTLK